MPGLYLTAASISYLSLLLLSLLITAYLGARLRSKEQGLSPTGGYLPFFLVLATSAFALTLFLDASLLPSERLFVVYSEDIILAGLLALLLQFAYRFPADFAQQGHERRLAGLVSGAYLLWETGITAWRFSMLQQGVVVDRQHYMDFWPALIMVWVVITFARSAARNRSAPTRRGFAFIFLIPLALTVMNALKAFDLVASPLFYICLSIGLPVTLLLFTWYCLIAMPAATSLLVRLSGVVLTALLVTFGVLAWLVAPRYAAQYEAGLVDRRTLEFTPNPLGGYDAAAIPFEFEQMPGQRLAFANATGENSSERVAEFSFPFFGRSYDQIFVSEDGLVSFGQALNPRDLEYHFSDLPLISAFGFDLDAAASPDGGVYLRREPDRLVITYLQVRSAIKPEREYTAQISLRADGSFRITHNGLPRAAGYEANDRPDASPWAFGAQSGQGRAQLTGFAALPVRSGPEGILQDEYRAFRQYMHAFLGPLALATLTSSLLFMLGLPLLLERLLTRPLRSLLAGMERLNLGQEVQPSPVQYNDEIGFLTRSFNLMSGRLDELIQTLETRVAERTADLLAANEQLRKLSIAVEQSPSAIVITNPVPEIEYVNPAFTHATGYTIDEVKGRNPSLMRSRLTSAETYRQMWETLLARRTWRGELANLRKDGEVFWEYTVIAPILDTGGNIAHYVAVKEDITARKAAEQSLLEREKQYRDLFELESDALFIIRNEDGLILEANSAASALYGYSAEELKTIHNTDLSAEPEATQQATRSPVPAEKVISIPLRWHRRKDGTIFPVEITARFIDWRGIPVHIAAIRDYTENYRARQELERLAITDPLTGITNRRHFFAEAEKIFNRSKQPPYELAALMIDVDHFKHVNDSLGHQAGDVVLREIAVRIRDNLRPTDLFARYGGEEFIVLLPRTALANLVGVADRLLHAINVSAIQANGAQVTTTISMGVAIQDETMETLDDLMVVADKALYAAKDAGGDRWAMHQPPRLGRRPSPTALTEPSESV